VRGSTSGAAIAQFRLRLGEVSFIEGRNFEILYLRYRPHSQGRATRPFIRYQPQDREGARHRASDAIGRADEAIE
jgi:hypothetical protein